MRNAFMILLIIGCLPVFGQTDFMSSQKKYARVRQAFAEKEEKLRQDLELYGHTVAELNILLVAYKAEKKLDLYVKREQDSVFSKFRSYPICRTSGMAGPKRREGDGQIPEGFYYINRFNPHSNFYLSLGINYPNQSDKILADNAQPGGDIFIHGDCVTIGCLPMTDDVIKEIYVLAVLATHGGQAKIPIYIFPFDMSENLQPPTVDNGLLVFWANIKEGFDTFMATTQELYFWVDKEGRYRYR